MVTALSNICGCGVFKSFVPMWISSFGLVGLTDQLQLISLGEGGEEVKQVLLIVHDRPLELELLR